LDGGSATTDYTITPNDDIMDAGGSLWKCVKTMSM
jgi:hypothetical protein